jgi:hypothetical protein
MSYNYPTQNTIWNDILQQSTKYTSHEEIWSATLQQTSKNQLHLEFGVWYGKSINFFSNLYPEQSFYGFDSFEGLPEDWIHSFTKGHFSLNGILPTVNSNVTLIKGWFTDTLNPFLLEHDQNISFIHIDCDLYSSTKYVLNTLKNRINPGTIILFDEFYNCRSDWAPNGECKAWYEFASENNTNFKYIGYNSSHEQVSLIIQ